MIQDRLIQQEKISIEAAVYMYRVQHRTMEGDCQYDHGPRAVKLSSFHIDKYPVTNAMFYEFINQTAYRPDDGTNFLKHWVDGKYPGGYENHPVVWVSPADAEAYAEWSGGRLPFDTEWQFAAAGPDLRKWPWGNEFDEKLCNNTHSGTVSVNRYVHGTSGFGCYDLSGNTWEWVGDKIDDGNHVFILIRGGSYYHAHHLWHVYGGAKPNDFHWKFQLLNEGMNRCGTIGFRTVK